MQTGLVEDCTADRHGCELHKANSAENACAYNNGGKRHYNHALACVNVRVFVELGKDAACKRRTAVADGESKNFYVTGMVSKACYKSAVVASCAEQKSRLGFEKAVQSKLDYYCKNKNNNDLSVGIKRGRQRLGDA